MNIDGWFSGYKVRSFPMPGGEKIYFSVSYYAPGQSLCRPPVWEKVAHIIDNEAGRRAVKDFTDTVTQFIARLAIPQGGHALLTFG